MLVVTKPINQSSSKSIAIKSTDCTHGACSNYSWHAKLESFDTELSSASKEDSWCLAVDVFQLLSRKLCCLGHYQQVNITSNAPQCLAYINKDQMLWNLLLFHVRLPSAVLMPCRTTAIVCSVWDCHWSVFGLQVGVIKRSRYWAELTQLRPCWWTVDGGGLA